MFCPSCGAKNEAGRAVCAACGKGLRPAAVLPARYVWMFHCQSLVVLAAVGVAALALLVLGWMAFRRSASPVVQAAPVVQVPPGISMPGQGGGADFAVSGCADGTLGQPGHVDNHIRINGVRDLLTLSEVDIAYPGARWHDPCTGGRGWQIAVVRSGADRLDLYFESATPKAAPVTYTVTLTYTDGTRETYTLEGTSGDW